MYRKEKFSDYLDKIKNLMESALPPSNQKNVINGLNNLKQQKIITKQEKGKLTYNDNIKQLQIALIYLGYKLPNFGADGLYHDETQKSIDDFYKNNNIKQTTPNTIDSAALDKIIEQFSKLNISSQDNYIKKNIEPNEIFSNFDITTNEGFNSYAQLCEKYISYRQPNLLNITGRMLANAALTIKRKYNKYLPPELALAQLVLEGGIGNSNPNSRPIKTKNPYNVGNVDDGSNRTFNNVESAINVYYDLMARSYLVNNDSPIELLNNFVNKNKLRYASDEQYEAKLFSIIKKINTIK